MKQLCLNRSSLDGFRMHLLHKVYAIAAAVICVLAVGTFLAGCGPTPVETQEIQEPQNTQVSAVPYSEAYDKLLAIDDAEQYDPAVLEAFAQWIDGQDDFLDTYPDLWELEQFERFVQLSCYSPLTEGYTRTVCNLIYNGKIVYRNTITTRRYTSVPKEVISNNVFNAKNAQEISVGLKSEFVNFIMDCDWFPSYTGLDNYQFEWHFEMAALPESEDQTEYITLFIEYWRADGIPGDTGLRHSIYYDGTEVLKRAFEPFALTTEVPEPTEPETTEPAVPFDYENSPAYQKLLTLPNADEFICNRFGNNLLAMFAQWIDSMEGVMETYSDRWYLKHYGDDGSALFCHTPLEADNSCDYMRFFIWYGGDIITDPSTGRRYFSDIPREEIAELIYGAYDPIGVDDELKERMVEEALLSEYFAWNVMDSEFKILDSYYEIRRNWPYPEQEPDNYTDDIYLIFHVWRPGMGEDDYIKCWLRYDEELKRVGFGLDGADEYWLSGIIPKS